MALTEVFEVETNPLHLPPLTRALLFHFEDAFSRVPVKREALQFLQ